MRDNKFSFLHLEGMDLAGKSSIAKIIKEKSSLNWEINNNRLSDKNEIYNFIDKTSKEKLYDDEIYGYLYYVALLSDLKRFKVDKDIIQDSTILLRSINYHLEHGNYQLAKMFENLIELHPIPTHSIYLTASIDTRLSRLAKRIEQNPEKVSKNDLMIINNKEKFIEMDNKLFSLSKKYFGSILLDTSDLTIEEAADYIIEKYSLHKDSFDKKKLKIKRR